MEYDSYAKKDCLLKYGEMVRYMDFLISLKFFLTLESQKTRKLSKKIFFIDSIYNFFIDTTFFYEDSML